MNRAEIGIITGLQAEAHWLRKAGFAVQAGGGTPEGAKAAAENLIIQGAMGLISFGLAGGLKPGLKPGAVLVPPAIAEGAELYSCDPALLAFLGGASAESMLAGQDIIASAEIKSRLYLATGCAAVDLESGAVGAVARAHQRPFAVLRAVADPAERNLPHAAMVALKPDGSLDALALLRSIARRPGQIPGLIAVGRDAAAARKALIERLNTLPATA